MAQDSFVDPSRFWDTLGLPAGASVVHLGCGAGFYLIPAAKVVGRAGKVIGIDVQQPLLEEAENRARREGVADTVHTIRANLEVPNGSTLPAAHVDWVLVANILHQAQADTILREAVRIVKPTGRVVVLDWKPGSSPLGPPTEARVSQEQAESLAAAAGLHKEQEFSPSPYHYGLILSKIKP